MEISAVPSTVFSRAVTSTESGHKRKDQDDTNRPQATSLHKPQETHLSLETKSTEQREQVQLDKLSARDREVRAHEAAHRNAGGRYVRGGSLETQRGPDGRLYAVGGDVRIDVSPVPGDPAATLQKAQVVYRAALAPARPSAQDHTIAAKAAQLAAQARADLARQRMENDGPQRVHGTQQSFNGMQASGAYASLASGDAVEAIDLVV